MANMSYCRFENTLSDLQDCFDKLCNISSLDELSDSEKKAAQKMIALCADIATDWVFNNSEDDE